VEVNLAERIQRQRVALCRSADVPEREIRVVVSPYRVCPIGAHIDHQRGPVLGMAIGAWSLLAFAPVSGSKLRMTSDAFPGEAQLDLAEPIDVGQGWGRYLRAAAWALRERLPRRPTGLVGSVGGSLPGGGLGSSASILVAYLLALAHANGLTLGPEELVALARRAENEFVGVASGILDPVSVVGSRRGRLLCIDTLRSSWRPIPLGPSATPYRILIAYSGTTRNLASTRFNQRVAECRAAAARLAELAGRESAEVLGDLPEAVFEAHLDVLPRAEQGRARHFHGECTRVLRGAEVWRRGDLEAFGRLMIESCQSSVGSYETGSLEQIELQRILLATPGVFGARFSGGGYGGCSVALVAEAQAEQARGRVEREFARACPHLEGRARAFLVDGEDGARLL
jgi:galactokinase/galacturonokinase